MFSNLYTLVGMRLGQGIRWKTDECEDAGAVLETPPLFENDGEKDIVVGIDDYGTQC